MKLNRVNHGDCNLILDTVSPDSVDLVYLDPPFFTQKEQSLTTRDGGRYFNFSDKWTDIEEYVAFMKERIAKCRRVMKPTGSLFLHCDKSAAHYLKVVLDSVFGVENFRSEIIWSYKRWSNSKKGLLNNHQTIFFYSKSREFKFNQIYEAYSPATNVDQIVQLRERDSRNKTVYKKNPDGTPALCSEKRGVPLGDVWDIPYLNPKAKERVSYPTQKPILLLERIIQLVTSEGDLVLDPFCGSGTSLVASKILKRNYIGIDSNGEAVELAKGRLLKPVKSESDLLKKGRDSYARTEPRINKIVSLLEATLVHRNKGIDCLMPINGQLVPVKVVDTKSRVEEAVILLQRASERNGYANVALFLDFECSSARKAQLRKKHGIIVMGPQVGHSKVKRAPAL